MTGKLSPEDLARFVFSRTGAPDDDLLAGPAYGEDAAAVDVGGETLVVSTDPISLAAERIGTLGVAVASNDVAACGGEPRWLTSTVFLPNPETDLLDTVTAQLDTAAEDWGMTIVGGHTESVAGLERPMLSLTCFGLADRYVPTGGAEPGDRVLLTKGAGVEATGVLATDFREDLVDAGVPSGVLARAEAAFEDLSVIPESRVLAPVATAMHDPTEGGVLAGLVELARASDVVLDVDADAIPVREETARLCAALEVDPLRVLGSGALLATVPAGEADAALDALADRDLRAADIGEVRAVDGPSTAEPGVLLEGRHYADAVRDDLYRLWK